MRVHRWYIECVLECTYVVVLPQIVDLALYVCLREASQAYYVRYQSKINRKALLINVAPVYSDCCEILFTLASADLL